MRDEHEAEDVTQQIFAKLLTALERYEPRSVPFSAWILRSPTTRRSTTCAPAAPCRARRSARPTLDDVDVGRERFADLRLALDALPAEQRDVIVLRFLLGLSPREIAERIGRSEDAVHGLQHRGRLPLRARAARAAAA